MRKAKRFKLEAGLMKMSYCQWERNLVMTLSVIFYLYHFVRTILSTPFCPIPFCPLPFCPGTTLPNRLIPVQRHCVVIKKISVTLLFRHYLDWHCQILNRL